MPLKTSEGDSLRHVEEDVLIPKIMKKRAYELCYEEAQKFFECCKGRTISAAWACRDQVTAMNNCLANCYADKNFYEDCKQMYLADRDQFQKTGVNPNKVVRRRGNAKTNNTSSNSTELPTISDQPNSS